MHAASQDIKNVKYKTPVFQHQNFHLPFVVQTDANEVTIADCLLQSYNEILKPVLYMNNKLNIAE